MIPLLSPAPEHGYVTDNPIISAFAVPVNPEPQEDSLIAVNQKQLIL
jgi:hypothetical protein